jgi:MFS family permease
MQYLQFVGGFEPWQAALHLIPLPFVMLPGTRIVGHLSKRHPQRLLGSIGMTAFAIAMFMFSTLGATFNLWLFEGALVLMATGIAFAATPATTAITSSLPEAKQGVASAVNDVAREFGSAIGIATLGAALTSAYKSNMITYADSVTFPPQIPADKVDEFSNFISDSPAVMSIDINDLPSALQPAKPFLETIWNALQNAATSAFSMGSGDALRLAGLIALGGAIFIAVVAPKKSSEAI